MCVCYSEAVGHDPVTDGPHTHPGTTDTGGPHHQGTLSYIYTVLVLAVNASFSSKNVLLNTNRAHIHVSTFSDSA